MIKSLEEDHDAGYISDEKYKELFNRYQKVLRQLNKEEADKEIKTENKKVNKPISNHEPSIEKSSSNINVNNINNQKKDRDKKVNNDLLNNKFDIDNSNYYSNDLEPKQDFITRYEREIMSVLVAVLIIFIILTIYILIAM
ncbi:hypothetical protein [Methanobrevibacter sp. AbM4]|uniref:hypothetical protein n=1 Tax=Methanobrevibacter sp. AbM4 TaxID=224719 RepID=UPI0003348D56|nr:hypothetical protein [Methanobrevibacter sp. AbM4]AGN16686.1 hypothetical protein Abm4_0795 [Methanobrevibacter sp. AbM4]